MTAPVHCPKFNACNAPICPLDPDWEKRTMTNSEGTCAWFREQAKAGPEARGVPGVIRLQVAKVLPQAIASPGLGPLRHQLKRAALTPSKRTPQSWAALMIPTTDSPVEPTPGRAKPHSGEDSHA